MRGITQKVFIDFSLPVSRISTDRHPTAFAVDVRSYHQAVKSAKGNRVKEVMMHDLFSPFELYDQDELYLFFRYLLRQVHVHLVPFIKQTVVISVPTLISQSDKEALVSVLTQCGFSEILLCVRILSAGVGGDVPISQTRSSLLLYSGYETSEAAVIALSSCQSLIGLDFSAQDTLDHIEDELAVTFGSKTDRGKLEKILEEVSTQVEAGTDSDMQVMIPKSFVGKSDVTIPAEFFSTLVSKNIMTPLYRLQQFILTLTPTQVSDLTDQGILLFGVPWLNRFVAREAMNLFKIPVYSTSVSQECVIKGLQYIGNNHNQVLYSKQ